MLLPWHIERGPLYAESVRDAKKAAGVFFEIDLDELVDRVRINPAEATPVTDADHRVLQIFPADEPSVALYIALDQIRHICRLEWVQVVPAEPEFEPWDGFVS
jgi:hypothetical protein